MYWAAPGDAPQKGREHGVPRLAGELGGEGQDQVDTDAVQFDRDRRVVVRVCTDALISCTDALGTYTDALTARATYTHAPARHCPQR